MVRLIKDELLIILGTSSSETVLPRLLAKLEAAGASRQTVGVVIPTGYSFNLDGTCIYLTLGALFIIQASGQDMSVGQQVALAALMVLTSKGAAGITGAGLVTLTASLQAFGGEFFSAQSIAVGIALVVGIDRIMSEGRALTNAIGNSVATMVIAGWQGERDDERFQAVLAEPGIVDREVQRAMRGEDDVDGHAGEPGARASSATRRPAPTCPRGPTRSADLADIEIRSYRPADEPSWLRCRVLAFLESHYYDDVLIEKPPMQGGLEMVALDGDDVAGLLDISVDGAAAMIESVAALPTTAAAESARRCSSAR